METMIDVQHVTKHFDTFMLKDISFRVPKGRIVGFIGENGAGKSTTIRCILEETNYQEGVIKLFDTKSLSLEMKQRIGVVFDENNYYDTLQLHQIDKMLKRIYSNWRSDIFHQYMKRFELPYHRKISQYSRGMKMKLSLAIALSHESELLILDEPTSGLDPVMREDILEVFLDFVQDETHSILLSSHISTDLEKIADEIVFIKDGEILFQMEKDELLYDYGIIRCTNAQLEQLDKEDIIRYRKQDMSWDVLVKDKDNMSKKYKGMLIDHTTLDDVMLLYVKGEGVC